ncbi:hypothetical protein [Pyxidicoccus caerfyrddinensis]|uniref:hypothetical protein n=1 Tax=Pyxidicoccus caerfyrddinensis TaxID=2709663 RepID=UPI0013D920BF|nr:hypothetical protein [Pyxidicoccus caerfyrddinensis]
MEDLLPPKVAAKIRDQYRSAVRDAASRYRFHARDEDSVTGALNEQIMVNVNGSVMTQAGEVTWATSAWKLRGRGKGAAEKRIGADSILEIEVRDADGGTIGRKLLPIQAKNRWTERDPNVANQARKIEGLRGVVVDYSPNGYFAVPASVAADAEGDRREIRSEAFRDLADVLADDLLKCTVGRRDAYFDAHEEKILFEENGHLKERSAKVSRRVRTRITLP